MNWAENYCSLPGEEVWNDPMLMHRFQNTLLAFLGNPKKEEQLIKKQSGYTW